MHSETFRKIYNKKFIIHELKECDILFSNIDYTSLDQQQRLSIVKDEDHNLIIAGAGSGKTTTVAGKVAYVINRYNINPVNEILLITFTKKASDEERKNVSKKKWDRHRGKYISFIWPKSYWSCYK